MNLFVINVCITDCISNLSGFHILNFIKHCLFVRLCICIRNKVNNCCNPLWNSLCWDYNDFFIFHKVFCLICCENNILVIWKNKNCLCIDLINGF